MERHSWLRRLVNWVENHKETIYFCGMIITLILAVTAGVWAYFEYPNPQVSSRNTGIVDVIISPFILGILHFLLVFFLGSLLSATISMTHARRMKAFNLEVEFEGWEHKEIKVGQAHYLSGILGNYDAVIGQFIDEDFVSYRKVMAVICFHYRNYFTDNFNRNLSYKIQSMEDYELSLYERQLLKYINYKGQDVGFQNRLIGNRTILMGVATTIVPDEEALLLSFQSDNGYEFDEYDVEAIRSLMKFGDIVLQHLYFIRD